MALIGISGKIGSGKDTVGQIIQVLCHLKKMDIPYSIEAVNYNLKNNFSNGKYYGDWEIKKFAGKLKQIVSLLTGCSVEDLEKIDFKNSFLGDEWAIYTGTTPIDPTTNKQVEVYQKITYRDVLQKVGTEAMRNILHENVWVNALFANYKCLSEKRLDIIDFGAGKTIHRGTPMMMEDHILGQYPNWIITDMRFPNELSAVEARGGITIRLRRTQWFKKSDLDNPDYVAKHEHPSETALDNAKFSYEIDNDGTIEELVEKVKNILIDAKII